MIKMPHPNKRSAQEKLSICEKVISGKSYADVGNEIGISGERVRQILCGAMLSCSHPKYDTGNCCMRTYGKNLDFLRGNQDQVIKRLYRWYFANR